MIKTDNNIFYMTLGEGCYITRVDKDKLVHVWFGRRVEPEDDLAALDGETKEPRPSEFFVDSGIAGETVASSDFAPDVVIDADTGERLKVDFVFDAFYVEDVKPECELPTLRGGKTLIVTLKDNALKLTARIYYTPYSRGGLTKRVVVTNGGDRTIRLRVPSGALRLAGEYEAVSVEHPINYMGLIGESDVYGFTLCYGGLAVMACDSGKGVTDFICEVDENVTLKPKESFSAPELLYVYSDSGRGGAARVSHDIVREFAVPERFAPSRRPIALVCPFADEVKAKECAAVAPELGADAFVMPYAPGNEKALSKASSLCKKAGIKFGVKLTPETELDLSDDKTVNAVFDSLKLAVKKYNAEYISLSEVCALGKSYAFTNGMYKLLDKLATAFSEVIPECNADLGSLCYSPIAEISEKDIISEAPLMLTLPPCVFAARVTDKKQLSLKTRFDIASFGCLGYALDPRALTEPMRRAIRAQVYSYQDDAQLVLNGDLYLLKNRGFVAVSKDKSKAYAVVVGGAGRVRFNGLDEHNIYLVRELDKTFSGAALEFYGLSVPDYSGAGETVGFHFSQVADYE